MLRVFASLAVVGLLTAGTGCATRDRVVVRGYAPPPAGVVVVARPVVTERVVVR